MKVLAGSDLLSSLATYEWLVQKSRDTRTPMSTGTFSGSLVAWVVTSMWLRKAGVVRLSSISSLTAAVERDPMDGS